MRRKTQFALSMVIILGALLGACSSPQLSPDAEVPMAEELSPEQIIPTEVFLPSMDTLVYFAKLSDMLPPRSGYGVVQAATLQEELSTEPKPFILDVREPAEVETEGFIEGAINIPLRQLLKNLDKLPAMDSKIVIYDSHGHRSGMALAALRLMGFTDVRIIGGGLSGWRTGANLPLVTGSMPAEPQVLTPAPVISDQPLFDLMDGFLSNLPDDFFITSPETLAAALAGTEKPVIYDVRSPEERAEQGYIMGDVNIPFNDFFKNIDGLPDKAAPIVIYSGGGGRSAMIVMGLRQMGFTNVYNLDGGIFAWKSAELPVSDGVNQ